jgi:hypothetical protein
MLYCLIYLVILMLFGVTAVCVACKPDSDLFIAVSLLQRDLI